MEKFVAVSVAAALSVERESYSLEHIVHGGVFKKSRHGGAKILEGQQIGCSNRSINERALFSCMKYCNDLLCDQKDKERIREEILENVRKVRYTSELLIDIDKITQKIGAIEAKNEKHLI